MALRQCKECGKEMSSKAKACPNCGAPSPNTEKVATATSIARIILMVVAILSVIPALMFGGLFGLIVPAVLFIMALCLK